jgi:ubiquinone biosynthesis protein
MARAPDILRTVRSLRRTGEILAVLARYGFRDFLQETGLMRTLAEGARWLGRERPLPGIEEMPREVRLRRVMETLGPTFIKLGQVLSTRRDLVPPAWADEFARLQSDCPQVEFESIRARLDEELGGRSGELFSSIDPVPLAAGSMAQVHRATLATGERVVIKVLRPGIHKLVQTDMQVLAVIADLVESHLEPMGYSPTDVVDEFARELRRELDLSIEARTTDRLREFFAADEHVSFPRIYWEATTRGVLTMEEIQGRLLSHTPSEELDADERKAIVAHGADAVFRQCFELGVFHADPHPGNIFVLGGGRIAFIDCGMSGHLEPGTASSIAELLYSVVGGDLDRTILAMSQLARIDRKTLDDRAFRRDVWEFVSGFENTTLERLDVGALLAEFFEKLRRHKVRCPSDIVFLIKAITTIEGIALELDPEFDVLSHVAPQVERLMRRRYGLRALRARLQRALLGYAELAEDLPREVTSLLEQLRRNEFSVRLEHHRLDRLTETVEHASRNVAYALIIAALLVGSSILILADRGSEAGLLGEIGAGGLVAAVMLILALVAANYRRGLGG